jgi:unsaturated chondroitin disaccharide hydrolase
MYAMNDANNGYGQMWNAAIGRMVERMEDTRRRVGKEYPHWAEPETGKWTTTLDGDWTGGYWAGMHWLAAKHTGNERYCKQASALAQGLEKRVAVDTVFKAFPFYYGAVLGAILYEDKSAQALALAGARSMLPMYNPALKLIPLGSQAEEGGNIGNIETSIDSLQAAPFLFWAARASGDEKMREIAHRHAATVIPLHLRKDNSFIQSSTLDKAGNLIKHHTHKGYSATSTWGRAQVWGILFSTMSYLAARQQTSWLEAAQRGADWWIAHVPSDHVAFWDFDDPAIPNTERDTAATAAASSALLKLSKVAKDLASRSKYRNAAEATVKALVTKYLTPTSPEDTRIPGMLTESCFNKRPDARPHDAANKCEFILADYYLLECLLVLTGKLDPTVL